MASIIGSITLDPKQPVAGESVKVGVCDSSGKP
jgi:hypothetical protein